MEFRITPDVLSKIVPRCKEPERWAELLTIKLAQHKMTSKAEVAAFLAQCAHESMEFNRLEENLNYSKTALKRVFSHKFSSDEEIEQYARNPVMIANRVYANRMSNGPEQSGDGWKFRGRGIIQLTGKHNIGKFGASIGLEPERAAQFLETKEGAIEGAIWFWKVNGLKRYIHDFKTLTRRINGGYHGLEDRIKYWNRAKRYLPQFGPETIDNFENLPMVRLGDTGPVINFLQNALTSIGYNVNQTGQFDNRTLMAVQHFQTTNNLGVDGIVGPNTWRVLDDKTRTRGGR